MPPTDPTPPTAKVRGFFRGLGEVGEFLREGAVAVIEVAIGRSPQPFAERRKKPKAPDEGAGLLKKIAPYPTED